MAWIESHQELARHPKTKRFARRLGVELPAAIGHLHLLWWWAMDYAADGSLSQYDSSDLADACLWSGDPEELLSALVGAGFLNEGEDGNLEIHDWSQYAGRLLERRHADADRKKASRGRPADVQRTSGGREHAVGGYRTVPYRTVPDPTNTPEGGTGETAAPPPPAYTEPRMSQPCQPEPGSPDADGAGAPSAVVVDKPRRTPALQDPAARAVATAVYDAIREAFGDAPADRSWFPRAATAARHLAESAREAIVDAVPWVCEQPEPRRGILAGYLSRCQFGLVVDAYRSAMLPPGRASPQRDGYDQARQAFARLAAEGVIGRDGT